MKQRLYEKLDGSAVTESMVLESSQLFNENYGVWSEQAARLIGKFAQAGMYMYIRLSRGKLRADYLPDDTSIAHIIREGYRRRPPRRAGNAFACRWTFDKKTVCWISPLVVHQEYRERGRTGSLTSYQGRRRWHIWNYELSSRGLHCPFGSKPI